MESKEITAVFIGNRDCYYVDKTAIEKAIITAIGAGVTIFLNGGQGYFDTTCAIVVHSLKKRYPQIKSYLIIPYLGFSVFNKDLYDEIICPLEEQKQTYLFYKGAIPKRNRIMVERSGTAICCVARSGGGAGKTLEYAKKKHLQIIEV